MGPGKRYPLFLYFEPEDMRTGQAHTVHVMQRDAKTHRIEGGSAYLFLVTPKREGNGPGPSPMQP